MGETLTIRQILEAVLFASAKPLPVKSLLEILKSAAEALPEDAVVADMGKVREEEVFAALEQLKSDSSEGRGYQVVENAGGWQVVTHPLCGIWVRQLFPELKPARLSPPAMETLAIIAYRQPIIKADIEAVRGVAVDGVMQTLLDRGLIKIGGRADVPGRPLLYETTQFFMEHFGLRHLDELPNSAELRRIALPQAPPPAEVLPPTELPPAPVEPVAEPVTEPVTEPVGSSDA